MSFNEELRYSGLEGDILKIFLRTYGGRGVRRKCVRILYGLMRVET